MKTFGHVVGFSCFGALLLGIIPRILYLECGVGAAVAWVGAMLAVAFVVLCMMIAAEYIAASLDHQTQVFKRVLEQPAEVHVHGVERDEDDWWRGDE